MKKILFLLTLFALPLFAGEKPQVLLIGDSISIAYRPHVVEAMKDRAVVTHHKGNAGPTMRGLAQIESWLGDTEWDVIHFNWGLWDMYGWRYEQIDRSPPEYEKRLEQLVERLKKTKATLIWATTTPACPEPEHKCKVQVTPELEKKYLAAAERVMKKHGVAINDLHAVIAKDQKKYALAPNDVHFTKEGSKALGAQVVKAIDAALK